MHPTETRGHTALLPGKASGMRQTAYVVDNLIGHLAEAIGAAIVVAETVILFAGRRQAGVVDLEGCWAGNGLLR